MLSLSAFHTEPGRKFDERLVDLLPVQLLDLRDLQLAESFGWMDIVTEEPIYVGVRYSADRRYSVTLQTWCLPEPPEELPAVPSIHLEKSTHGEDADDAPGVEVASEGAVVWEYRVTNTGDEPLASIELTDDVEGAITCPGTELAPGESMTCTHESTAPAAGTEDFFYANVGSVTGTPPTGSPVSDEDPSHYWVRGEEPPEPKNPKIGLEKTTNDVQADTGRGPELALSQAVTWSYAVTNLGDEALENVQLTDDREGAIACPKTTLAVGESMTCVKTGVAAMGDYRNMGTVTGKGALSGKPANDDDPSAYHVEDVPPPPASIDLEKATNGHDADTGPGPQLEVGDPVTWTYVVTNTGEDALANVSVTDDREGSISCPKTTLAAGEAMTCSHSGTAVEGQYANLGTVTGDPESGGDTVSDSDPSHYYAEEPPEECGACEGKVTRLTLRYLGSVSGAHVQVIAKRGPSNDPVFDGILFPGDTFEVIGPASGSGGFAGNLGTEITFLVNGGANAQMHTSCSSPIGPGLVAGDFEVLEGASSGGGLLCSL
jgi:hypothetical protein